MNSQKDAFGTTIRYLLMLMGLTLLGGGIALSTKAALGTSAWTVFHIGVAKQIGWTQGQVTQVVGLLIVAASYFMGHIKPAPATICNMILVGRIVDFFILNNLIPDPASMAQQYIYLLTSVIITGMGSALYISVRLGAGPRDSLMLALTQKSGLRIGLVRNSIELGVLAIGWFLGGPVGIGTLVYALAIGPVLEVCLYVLRQLTTQLHLERFLTVIEPKVKRAKTA